MAPPRRRDRRPPDLLELANKKTDEAFIEDYLKPSEGWTTWQHPRTGDVYDVTFARAGNLTDQELLSCLALIEETSRPDYEASSMGWDEKKKLKEMKSPDLRYVLVKNKSGEVRAFTSLMPTYEEGEPVVYCYEIHLKSELQRSGLGSLLMGYHTSIASRLPLVHKVMLTCFLSNERGLEFYRKLGFEKDAISPEVRKLRFGKEIEPDYVILSKKV